MTTAPAKQVTKKNKQPDKSEERNCTTVEEGDEAAGTKTRRKDEKDGNTDKSASTGRKKAAARLNDFFSSDDDSKAAKVHAAAATATASAAVSKLRRRPSIIALLRKQWVSKPKLLPIGAIELGTGGRSAGAVISRKKGDGEENTEEKVGGAASGVAPTDKLASSKAAAPNNRSIVRRRSSGAFLADLAGALVRRDRTKKGLPDNGPDLGTKAGATPADTSNVPTRRKNYSTPRMLSGLPGSLPPSSRGEEGVDEEEKDGGKKPSKKPSTSAWANVGRRMSISRAAGLVMSSGSHSASKKGKTGITTKKSKGKGAGRRHADSSFRDMTDSMLTRYVQSTVLLRCAVAQETAFLEREAREDYPPSLSKVSCCSACCRYLKRQKRRRVRQALFETESLEHQASRADKDDHEAEKFFLRRIGCFGQLLYNQTIKRAAGGINAKEHMHHKAAVMPPWALAALWVLIISFLAMCTLYVFTFSLRINGEKAKADKQLVTIQWLQTVLLMTAIEFFILRPVTLVMEHGILPAVAARCLVCLERRSRRSNVVQPSPSTTVVAWQGPGPNGGAPGADTASGGRRNNELTSIVPSSASSLSSDAFNGISSSLLGTPTTATGTAAGTTLGGDGTANNTSTGTDTAAASSTTTGYTMADLVGRTTRRRSSTDNVESAINRVLSKLEGVLPPRRQDSLRLAREARGGTKGGGYGGGGGGGFSGDRGDTLGARSSRSNVTSSIVAAMASRAKHSAQSPSSPMAKGLAPSRSPGGGANNRNTLTITAASPHPIMQQRSLTSALTRFKKKSSMRSARSGSSGSSNDLRRILSRSAAASGAAAAGGDGKGAGVNDLNGGQGGADGQGGKVETKKDHVETPRLAELTRRPAATTANGGGESTQGYAERLRGLI